MQPDAIVEVRFKTTVEGGRESAVGIDNSVADWYGCPLVVDGEAFDCRLLLAGRRLELGGTYEVPVKFLNPQLVLPRLTAGTQFVLWEGKDIATGKVVRVLSDQSS
jgi:hypothetical protein